jgi:hypothetical protein
MYDRRLSPEASSLNLGVGAMQQYTPADIKGCLLSRASGLACILTYVYLSLMHG